MGLLSSLAKASARASGRALARHVLPDSLVPSWKTQKTLSSGYSLLKKAAKTKKVTASGKGAARPAKAKKPLVIGGFQIAKPSPKKPAKKFDQQGWALGRALPSGAGFPERPQSSPKSSFLSSAKQQAKKLRQQSKDLVKNPRAVARMGVDLLYEDYQVKKKSFLSELRDVRSSISFKKK